MIASFCFFLIIFTGVGLLSYFKRQSSTSDYLLAGRSISPWLSGLSAVATNNSGFMFTGMIGYTYMTGLSALWVLLPWVFGDFIASFFIHKRLRAKSEELSALTFPALLSQWTGTSYSTLRRLSAILIIIFLGVYAAAQLSAGSKALYSIFQWDYHIGAVMGSLIVILYCFSGGIRASIWTDAAQSMVMMGSMVLIVVAAVQYLGNVNDIVGALKQVSPYYLSWVPPNITNNFFMGISILIVSWTFAGFGVIGQPHIMIRFMALNHVDSMSRARCIYYVWYIIFSVLTIMAGLAARVILPNTNGFDAELALPMLSQMLLAPVFVGFILAGLFSATMSTADSQILSCAAAITQDLNWGKKNYVITKLGTIGVTLIALSIAIFGSDSVFGLVTIAWAALGCAFSPLIIVFICGGKPSQPICVGMIMFSLISMMFWKLFVPNSNIYEILPGFFGGFLFYFVGFFFTKLRDL